MEYKDLKEGCKVFFIGEVLPMELISRTDRYGVVVRSLDIKEDYDLIYFEVERGAYFDCESAYEALKKEPVYSLLDFVKEKRGASNLIFCSYDFFSKMDCFRSVVGLESGYHEISKRNGIDLKIDWTKTK